MRYAVLLSLEGYAGDEIVVVEAESEEDANKQAEAQAADKDDPFCRRTSWHTVPIPD